MIRRGARSRRGSCTSAGRQAAPESEPMPPAQPHDAFSRSLLEAIEWTSAFLRGVLDPGIVALLPDEPFAVFESGFVDSELRITRADGVFSIRLTDGRKLFAIIENKSAPDVGTPLQIAEYVLRVWRAHERLEGRNPAPLIVPIVLYQGAVEWTSSLHCSSSELRSRRFRHLAPN